MAWWCCRAYTAARPSSLAFQRTAGDFLTALGEVPVGTPLAAGALLLPARSR